MRLIGTLTTAGTYHVTVTATDQDGTTASVAFDWTVTAGVYTPPVGSLLPDVEDPEALRLSVGGNTHFNFVGYPYEE